MECPQCHQPVEAGARFCGNCGQALAIAPVATTTISDAVNGASQLPTYAVPVARTQRKHIEATAALVLGVMGIVGALFIGPIIGLLFGVAGLVFGTMAHHWVRRLFSYSAIVLASLAVVVGLGTWTYASAKTQTAQKQAQQASSLGPASSGNGVSMPCYQAHFERSLNIEHATGSCAMNAYDGETMNTSQEAFKVYAVSTAVDQTTFASAAKNAIEKDVSQSLSGFHITDEGSSTFSGSPAYIVNTVNNSGVSLVEAIAFHKASNGNDLFVFVHAVTGKTADLKELERGWKWQ